LSPLPAASAESAGLDPLKLERACALIEEHIAAGVNPGGQIAVVRHGKLVLDRVFGAARLVPAEVPVTAETLFLAYSNTKVVTASAIWKLVEDGRLRFDDPAAAYLPGFEKHGKGEVTILHLLTHQGGFPNAMIPLDLAEDHDALRAHLNEMKLEWLPGTNVHYHSASGHWVLAMVIEAITGMDYRDFIQTAIIEPLGLGAEMALKITPEIAARCADMHARDGDGPMLPLALENSPAYRHAGRPGGGIHSTARAFAAFYQMLLQGGQLGGTRLLSPRMIAYASRNFTGERINLMNGRPAHRALGPTVRGDTDFHPGHGAIAHPLTLGHAGMGSSYCWGDPDSGVSFAFVSNGRLDDDAHDRRMELLSTVVHASIIS
jgi:CubicO group peptidase (beta-lactamase class C family)